MKLTLTDDAGVLIETWYIPDEETVPAKVRSLIEGKVPVYESREEYEQLTKE